MLTRLVSSSQTLACSAVLLEHWVITREPFQRTASLPRLLYLPYSCETLWSRPWAFTVLRMTILTQRVSSEAHHQRWKKPGSTRQVQKTRDKPAHTALLEMHRHSPSSMGVPHLLPL